MCQQLALDSFVTWLSLNGFHSIPLTTLSSCWFFLTLCLLSVFSLSSLCLLSVTFPRSLFSRPLSFPPSFTFSPTSLAFALYLSLTMLQCDWTCLVTFYLAFPTIISHLRIPVLKLLTLIYHISRFCLISVDHYAITALDPSYSHLHLNLAAELRLWCGAARITEQRSTPGTTRYTAPDCRTDRYVPQPDIVFQVVSQSTYQRSLHKPDRSLFDHRSCFVNICLQICDNGIGQAA